MMKYLQDATSAYYDTARIVLLLEARHAGAHINQWLIALGLEAQSAKLFAHGILKFTRFSVVLSIIAVLCLPSFEDYFPALYARIFVVILTVVALLLALVTLERQCRKYRTLITMLSFWGRAGFCSAVLFEIFPVLLLVAMQYFHGRLAVECCNGLQVILDVIALIVIPRKIAFVNWILTIVVIAVSLLDQAFMLDVPFAARGIDVNKIYTINSGVVNGILLMLMISLVAGLATYLLSVYLGKLRLAPRNRAVCVLFGVFVCLAVVSIASFSYIVGLLTARTHLANLIIICGVMTVSLVFRIRAARYVNLESLGFGLFIARSCGVPINRVVSFYRFNWLMLTAPIWAVAVVLLLMSNAFSYLVLLSACIILEFAIDEFVVQRRPTILAASQLDLLGFRSVSGVGSGICLVALCSASGVGGMTLSCDFHINDATILLAGAAIVLISLVLVWLRRQEALRWFRTLRVIESI